MASRLLRRARVIAYTVACFVLLLTYECTAFETIRLVNDGTYTGNEDTQLEKGKFFGTSTKIEWDGDEASVLLKWAIFAREGGPIPDGSLIYSAKLRFYKDDDLPGDEGRIHEVLVPWNESTTWETFGPTSGVSKSDYASGTVSTISASLFFGKGWKDEETVTSSVRKWSNPDILENNGWIIVSGLISVNQGYEIVSSEGSLSKRPYLTIEYDKPESVNCSTFQDTSFQDLYSPPIYLHKSLCVACTLPSRAGSANMDTASVLFNQKRILVRATTPPNGWNIGFCFDVPTIEAAEGNASLTFSLETFNSIKSMAFSLKPPDVLDCTTVTTCENDTLVIDNNVIVNDFLVIDDNVVIKGDLTGTGDVSLAGNLTVEGCLNVTGGINVVLNDSRVYEAGEVIAFIDYNCRDPASNFGISGGTTKRACESLKAESRHTHTGALLVVNIDDSNCEASLSNSSLVYVLPVVIIIIIITTIVIVVWAIYRYKRRKSQKLFIEDSMKHMQTSNTMPTVDTEASETQPT